MIVTNFKLPVMSSWMLLNGRRLDSNPYLGGSIEAKAELEKLRVRKRHLKDVTKGNIKGIFKGKMIKRIFVENPKYGVPFLTTSGMLQANFLNIPLLAQRYVKEDPNCLLEPETILISAAGTIGRITFTRPDMAGMFASSDIMKIIADKNEILPGCLFAMLSSRFGVPLVTSGTFGSIIQHIEPQHLANLPIPEFPEQLQRDVHKLVIDASNLRAKADECLNKGIILLESNATLLPIERKKSKSLDISVATTSKVLQKRLDGFFHSQYHKTALESLLSLPKNKRIKVGDLAKSVFEPTRFKRVPMEDSDYGIPFFGTAAIMWANPEPMYFLPKTQKSIEQYIVDTNTLLIPRSGQLSGIIGSVVIPHGKVIGGAVSEDAIRIYGGSDIITGYIFIALSSMYGQRQLKARTFGSSIPHLDVRSIKEVLIPNLEEHFDEIGELGLQVSIVRTQAVENERLARNLIETWVKSNIEY